MQAKRIASSDTDISSNQSMGNEEMEDILRYETENVVEEGEEVSSDNFQEDEKNLVASFIFYILLLAGVVVVLISVRIMNRNIEEKADSLGDEKQNLDEEREEVADNVKEDSKVLVTSTKSDIFPPKDQMQAERNIQPVEVKGKFIEMSNSTHPEGREATRLMPEHMFVLLNNWINILPEEMKRKFINMSKSIHPEDSLANFKLLVDITTSSDKTGEELIKLKNASAEERSKRESTRIRVYRNVMRNETCRMMRSIDMVVSKAEHLFGHERTQIFFNLLDAELFQFGSVGTAPGFIPNMTESTVRQHVISFFEHSCDVMNRLMTLLLGCPDRKRLQQMPEQKFISLMQSVIGSSLKTKIKGGKRLTSKGNTFVMVDSEEFEKALGDEILEDVLDRRGRGDEMVVHRFVDTRLERTRAPQGRENRPIHSIFFPSDRKMFISIPTENGSYWHQVDMQRASRIRRNDK